MDLRLDDRRLRWLLWAALAVLAAGIWFFFLRGADQPEDPVVLDDAAGATSTLLVDGVPRATEPPAATDGGAAPAWAPPCDPGREPLPGFAEVAISVAPGDGSGLLAWCLLAATDREQRGQGMIGVTDLQGYDGMAFVYAAEVQNPYHMQHVPMPLSIAWVGADGRVVDTADMDPCTAEDRADCPLYASDAPFDLAIEVPQGRLEELGITEGAVVRLAGACAARG